MSYPSPTNANEKWLYVSDIWDGSGSPIYTTYNNILGNTVAANQAAVDALLGYAYAHNYTGLFLYDQNRYRSGATYTTNGKNILRNFVAQAYTMGLQVGAVISATVNSIDATIEYNNTCSTINQKFTKMVTENEWWWWSYDDIALGPCGEIAFIQMKNNLSSKRAASTAAGLQTYVYTGWARDVGYSYTGTYTCGGGAVRNGSTVVGASEIDQLIPYVDAIMLHDYVTTPNWGYMRSRAQMVNANCKTLAIVSSEPGFSANWFEGKNSSGVACCPKKSLDDAYNYIAHTLGLSSPAQTGSPISFDAESDADVRSYIDLQGIVNFHYQHMVDDTHALDTKNGTSIWVNAGVDQVVAGPSGSVSLAGAHLDDYMPIGSTRTVSWAKTGGPAGATITNSNTLTPTFNFIAPGIYTIVLTVSDGSTTATDTVRITVTGSVSALTANIAVNVNETCEGDCDAEIEVTPVGGTAPYTYLWVPGGNTSAIQQNVCDGDTYSVTVTDSSAGALTTTASYTYNKVPGRPTVTLTTSDVTTYGGSDGEITAQGVGGSGTYQYMINLGGAAWEPVGLTSGSYTYTGLAVGTYIIMVRDAQTTCTSSSTAAITQPAQAPAVLVTAVVKPACNSLTNNGSIDVTVSGGVAPYTYLWSNGATTQDISGLSTGSYRLVVTDNVGTSSSVTLIVNASTPSASVTSTNIDCYGGSNGTILLTITGGTPAYGVNWNNGSRGTYLTGLTAGTYVYTVYDANGCSSSGTVTLTQPPRMAISVSYSQPSSVITSDGSITANPSGGTRPYTYLWSTGATTQTVSGLAAGSYRVTVTDANGCAISKIVTLFAQDKLQIAIVRAKCCLGDLAYKFTKAQEYGLPTVKCLKRNLLYLEQAVCLLGRFVDGNSCIDTLEAADLLERISMICGCCSCDWDSKLFIDTL